MQVANVVLGFESDIDWADISGSGTTTPSFLGTPLDGYSPGLSLKLEYLFIAAASVDISKVNTNRAGLNYRIGGN